MAYKLLIASASSEERLALRQILTALSDLSVTILEADNGQCVLNLFRQELPDILFLRVELPDFSGLEAAIAIRKSSHPCAIVFLGDLAPFALVRQAVVLQASDFLTPPLEPEKIIGALRESLRTLAASQDSSHIHSGSTPSRSRLSLAQEDILHYIETHYMEDLSMKHAARTLNYSEAYFSKLFKQYFGMNFSTYLSEYRIRKAKDLMTDCRFSIKDISQACGYPDPNYFSRVFRKATGLTPTEYRLNQLHSPQK